MSNNNVLTAPIKPVETKKRLSSGYGIKIIFLVVKGHILHIKGVYMARQGSHCG
jgi:hypothetical protein